MNRNAIRLVLIFGILSITGILAVEFYLVQRALNQEDIRLNQSLSIALTKVSEKIARYNEADPPHQNPVVRKARDYYVVNVNGQINPEVLEHYLKQELLAIGLTLDFEYGIYDCQTDEMVFGNYMHAKDIHQGDAEGYQFEKHPDFIYYFGIHFPRLRGYVLNSLGIWYFFSIILLLVVVFFAYTQFIILRQRRYTEIQRDFINTMTHEFKTPLASLLMASEVISDPTVIGEPERLKRYGGIVRDQARHLLNQVELVLGSAGTIQRFDALNQERVNIREVVDQALNQMEPKIQAAGALVSVHWIADEALIRADRGHLTNILFNLIDNSLKYTDTQPRITISWKIEGRHYILCVEDQGFGIPVRLQKKVFDRFYRVPTGNVHNVKGFGLGLFYVRNKVKAHGWRITLDSHEGKGTRFCIFIPKIQVKDESAGDSVR